MNRKLKPVVLVIALLMLAGLVAAVPNDLFDNGTHVTGPAGIENLAVVSNGANIYVYMTLHEAPITPKIKYRVHFDYADGLAIDDDRNDDQVVDGADYCYTTSDDTMTTRIHRQNKKDTGPGTISVDGLLITYQVSYAELGLTSGDTVLIWADTHDKGIVDRAPDTEIISPNSCSKPERSEEVLTHVLAAPT
jgi:hypothetical protein